VQNKAYIRVSMGPDGKTPQRELMCDGLKVCDISYVEVIELVMQASSSLRFEKHSEWPHPPRAPQPRPHIPD
jgi:hypothetical protein